MFSLVRSLAHQLRLNLQFMAGSLNYFLIIAQNHEKKHSFPFDAVHCNIFFRRQNWNHISLEIDRKIMKYCKQSIVQRNIVQFASLSVKVYASIRKSSNRYYISTLCFRFFLYKLHSPRILSVHLNHTIILAIGWIEYGPQARELNRRMNVYLVKRIALIRQ